jgi:hypothetical protein
VWYPQCRFLDKALTRECPWAPVQRFFRIPPGIRPGRVPLFLVLSFVNEKHT